MLIKMFWKNNEKHPYTADYHPDDIEDVFDFLSDVHDIIKRGFDFFMKGVRDDDGEAVNEYVCVHLKPGESVTVSMDDKNIHMHRTKQKLSK